MLGLAWTPAATADEAAERSRVDRQIHAVLRDIHNRGADLYNNGDAAGCYRLFQGSLVTVRPLLDHHPEVQKMIDKGLADAEATASLQRRAFSLHTLIEDIRGKIKPAPGVKESTEKKTEGR
jgi:hypothetical protein